MNDYNDAAPKRLEDAEPRPLPQKIERDVQSWAPNARVGQGWASGFVRAITATSGVALLFGLVYLVYTVFKSYV